MHKLARSPLALAGAAVLVVGCAPLAAVGAADVLGLVHDANPIGFGLLAMVSMPLGLTLIEVGRKRAEAARGGSAGRSGAARRRA
jgi:hypothetical protein